MRERPTIDRALAHPVVVALAVGIVTAVAYANAFAGDFVFDDVPVLQNPLLRHLGNYALGGPGYAEHPSRWIAYASFAANYALGGPSVFGFHAVNVAIHAASALLVYALVVSTFRTPRLARSALAGSSSAVALAAALLFATHPLQTQAVSYVVQRIASLATLFYLLAVVLYARWRLAGAERPAWTRAVGYLAVLGAAVLAMKTKEIAFTLPAAVAIYEWAFLEGPARRRAAYLLPIAATAALVPLSLVGLDAPAAEILARTREITAVETTMSRWDYLATQLPVIVTYLRLLALPVGQNVDHDQPIHRSLLEPEVLGSLAVIAALALAAAYLVRRTSPRAARPLDPAARLVAFGIAWFFVGLSVESGVIPIADVIAEHRVYLPSFGFFAAVATAGALAARRWTAPPGRAISAVAVGLAVLLAGLTHHRNRAWASSLALWSDAVEKSPNKTRPHSNLALALAALGREEEALAHFQAVVRIRPDHVSGYNNLAVSLARLGRAEEAVRALDLALRMKPDHAETYFNLGSMLMDQRRNEEAAALLGRAIALDPGYVGAYANLAGALNELGRAEETVRLLEPREAVLRDSVEARFNLGVAYVLLRNGPGAARAVSTLSRVAPERAAQLAEYMRAQQLP